MHVMCVMYVMYVCRINGIKHYIIVIHNHYDIYSNFYRD